MNYKLGSLFDGSGGFPLAGSLCGIEPVWASEVEPYPIAVTKSRFKNMKHLGDISKINGAEIEPVDIITFGSPCQDLSVAGKRAGLKHEANGDEETTRSGLFMEAVRIIKEMRKATNGRYPNFAIWENVPGAFSSNKGEDFKVVLEELIKIVEPSAVMPEVPQKGWAYADCYSGDGWSLAYRVLDAQYWGVPQRRRRIYLVADFRGECAKEILFEREGLRGYFTQGRTPWQNPSSYAERSLGADDREGETTALSMNWQAAVGAGLCVEEELTSPFSCTRTPTVLIPYTLKIRSGCEGGGKGALIQKDKSATLATNNDQYLFQSIGATGIIDNVGGQAGQGYPCTVYAVDQGGGKSQANVSEEKAPTLCTTHGGEPAVAYGLDRASFNQGQNAKFDFAVTEESQPTLTARGPGAVAQPILHASKASFFMRAAEGAVDTLVATDYKDPQMVVYPAPEDVHKFVEENNADAPHQQDLLQTTDGVARTIACGTHASGSHLTKTVINHGTHYIVRRLTPTECARLQGFADRWGDIDTYTDFTDEEYKFWLEVRKTYDAINGRQEKDYTKKQILTWYNKLQADSAEYKMWGNGIALPTALYVLQGVAEALSWLEFME